MTVKKLNPLNPLEPLRNLETQESLVMFVIAKQDIHCRAIIPFVPIVGNNMSRNSAVYVDNPVHVVVVRLYLIRMI